MPLVAALSVGIDVRAPLNWNWPRTPPASWIWSRKSSLWRTSVPTLIVWLPVILVSIPTTLNGLLAAVPGEAGREADHRVREAVADADPADAARELVVVGARDAHLGRAVEARARGERLVVVLHVAGPPLHDQALAEGPRPGEGGAVGVLVAGAGEVGAGAAELAERPGDEDLRPLVAEAQRHLVARGGVVVQLDVEGVRRLLALAARQLVVHLAEGGPGDVRLRDLGEDVLGHGAEAVRGDDVAGERRAARAVGVAGGRVVDLRRGAREVAVPPLGGGDDHAAQLAEVVHRPLVVGEEEELVLDDRAAEGGPELLVLRLGLHRGGRGEGVLGLGRLGVREGEDAALELVGARLHDDRGHRPAGAPELGVEVRRGHVDGVDRLGGGDEDGEEAGPVVVVEPVDLDVVRQARLAVELGLLASPGG